MYVRRSQQDSQVMSVVYNSYSICMHIIQNGGEPIVPIGINQLIYCCPGPVIHDQL